MSEIQSVLFDKNKYSVESAKKWLDKRNLHPIKQAHITQQKIRFRLQNPDKFNKFRIGHISDAPNVEFVYGIK